MRALYGVRALYGAMLLISPATVARLLRCGTLPPDGESWARLLGVRHLGQAAVTWRYPRSSVLVAGTASDVAHCASMVALATLDERWRVAASHDAVVAGVFAGLNWAIRS